MYMCDLKQGSGGDCGAHHQAPVLELPNTEPPWSNLLHHSAGPQGLLVQEVDGETGEEVGWV